MKIKTKDLYEFIIYFILLIPFFKSSYIAQLSLNINKIYNILQICSMGIILFLFIKRGKISKFIIIVAIFEIIVLISSIISSAEVKESFFSLIQIFVLCSVIEYGLSINPKIIIKTLLSIFELMIYINFITILMFPKGMYINSVSGLTSNWFLGNDNGHIIYFIVGIVLSFIYSYMNKKNIGVRTYILIFVCALSVFMRFSATTVIGFLVFICYISCINKLYKIKVLNIKNYWLIFLLAFVLIVVFRLQESFTYLIVNIFDKDLTLTGRTKIWDKAIEYIKLKPILGYGIESQVIRLEKYKVIGGVHAHDIILEILYQSGIIGLNIYSYIIYLVSNILYKIKDNKIESIISIAIFIVYIMMIAEVYNFSIIIILLLIGYNIEKIINIGEKGEKQENKK